MYKDFKIIDAHAHIFPEKIAHKATLSIGNFYGIPMEDVGVCSGLIEGGEKINVDKYLVCSTATVKEQVVVINDFIKKECDNYKDKFIGFGTLHPEYKDVDSEIKRMKDFGFKGVKLHPDFQRFNIDDKGMDYIYSALEDSKLPVLIHVGDERYEFSTPQRLVNVAKKFKRLKVIAPHFGGYRRWDDVERLYNHENIFCDTSSALSFLERERAVRMIEKIGHKKFFFGSDFPMWKHEEEFNLFMNLGLSREVCEDILALNFEREILDCN